MSDGFLQRLISKGNSSYESGRAQYHLKALQAIFQGPFSKKEAGHVISEQENYHCISSVLNTIENEMNGRYDHIYLSACLTKFSKLLNEIRFEEYTFLCLGAVRRVEFTLLVHRSRGCYSSSGLF